MKLLLFVCSLAVVVAIPHKLRKDNPDERGDYFEGDIAFPLPHAKNGIIDESAHWTGGKVYYKFSSTYSVAERRSVQDAMDRYEEITGGCITFQERTFQTDYIEFLNDQNDGCHSNVGRAGGRQEINYPQWCLDSRGSTLHEMLHALGFFHEQSRTDRDNYVTIEWGNIEAGKLHNFEKYDADYISGYGEDYDYSSVMHYSEYAFSKNGEMTIVPQDPNANIGQRFGLSDVDLKKLMNMYKC